MFNSALLTISLICYLAATIEIARAISKTDQTANSDGPQNLSYALAVLAVIAHLLYAYDVSFIEKSVNFALSSMAVLVSGFLVVIFLLGGTVMPIRKLGILVFPFTVASLLFSLVWDSQTAPATNPGLTLTIHILTSIVAYSLLAIAAIQALLYVYQEKQIKNRSKPAMLMALPPLQTMETLLFRLAGTGFLLLTLTVVSGAIFSQQIFGQPFVFKHHTVLGLMGWMVFAVLLFKRIKTGLRGSQAVVWTIGGFLLIQLGYFGTKIVSEILSVQ